MSNLTLSNQDKTADYLEIQTAEGLDYRLEIAGMGARSHAFIIDWHIRILLAITWFALIGLIFFKWAELLHFFSPKQFSATSLVLLISAALIYFLYHPVLEIFMAGRTPGKRMAGVRLVNLNGHSPSIAAILIRNLFRLIDCLPGFYFVGLVSVAITRRHVRIGDLAAGLVLVYDESIKPKTMRQITDLAMNSNLSSDDQALLLDLLTRWKELSSERRIHLAEQFLKRIGMDLPTPERKNKLEASLKKALVSLLTPVEH